MKNMLANLAVIRSRREMVVKVLLATLGITLATDAVDAAINLYTQPDRLWPSLIQTTFTASAMSALFLSALAHANLKLFRLKEQFEALSLTDVQTGLLNRRGFFATLERSRSVTARATLLVLDIDHFKRINDTYGHLVGDYVIAEVGRTLNGLLKPPHFAGRIGGEEFSVTLQQLSREEAMEIAERLRWSVARLGGSPLPPELHVTVSVGLSEIGDRSVMAAFARADAALYEAKREGRNMCVDADGARGGKVIPMPLPASA
ncbi:GGDEF domain-containing protein [Aureimonas sp. ME7]|uniref:GGDEF domain-containing protein n=1 Tax=Aureimonas sp. ME7 TaxID=2744252 RepID=UPI0015F59B0D|nr:GGDEF domain-containing protein [Aureimonas sp. ME7]